MVGDEPFFVHLADDLIDAEEACLAQMARVFEQRQGSVLGVAREEGAWRLSVREVHRVVPALLATLAEHGLVPSQLSVHSATLEDVFVHLTGRTLRDA